MAESEFYFPFDAVLDTNGEPDRAYLSEHQAMYVAQFLSNGVYAGTANGLQVLAINDNMYITVQTGSALIQGRCYYLKETANMLITAGNVSYGRYDIVVCRLDYVNRLMGVYVKEGTPAASPVKPTLQRDSDIYELKLAEIYIASGATSLAQVNVTDFRANSTVCGFVTNILDGFDADDYFTAYNTAYNQFMASINSQFTAQYNNNQTTFNTMSAAINTWYNSVKTDIALLQTIDFDNIAVLPGVIKNTVFTSDTVINETLSTVGVILATRATVFNADGSISVTFVAYDTDGTAILFNTTTTTVFNGDGSITETVSQNY